MADRWVWAVVVGGLLFGLGAKPPPTTLRAERIELVDDTGTIRAWLSAETGGPVLTLADGTGAQAVLRVEHGVPELRLRGQDGVTSELGVHPRPEPVLNGHGKPHARAPRPAGAERALAAPGDDTIQVRIPADVALTKIEVKCPSGFRARAHFFDQVAIMDGVPQEACTVMFKGSIPAKSHVTGGDSLECTFVGGAANCQR